MYVHKTVKDFPINKIQWTRECTKEFVSPSFVYVKGSCCYFLAVFLSPKDVGIQK